MLYSIREYKRALVRYRMYDCRANNCGSCIDSYCGSYYRDRILPVSTYEHQYFNSNTRTEWNVRYIGDHDYWWK